MKHEKVSIKWKLFAYLLIFSAILLLILWILQTVYLDNFYKYVKRKQLKSAQKNLLSVMDDENHIEEALSAISKRYDICILIADSDGNMLCSSEDEKDCIIHKLDKNKLVKIYQRTIEKGNSMELDLNGVEGVTGNEYEQETREKFLQLLDMPKVKHPESVIKANVVKRISGKKLLVLSESLITPLGATVHTLRIQFVYISAIMVVLSMILAFIISKKVSQSIISLSTTAKELTNGNYEIEFNGRDYKEIAQLTDTLNQAARELERADLLQKELIANVSHDLRTPLTMIIGYAEVMRDIPGENTPENVQVIIDETTRLTFLVNDLLDMSKINAGVAALETREYDLTESIKSVVNRNAKLVEPYGYELSFDYQSHVFVDADEFKMYQVIYNIISNAINYSGREQHIYIRQKVLKNMVRIEVEDTGTGIPKEELENVWERYYKVDKNHKRAVVGTGIGLSIAKNILEMHNAEYGVESEMGKGSTFWFQLEILEEKL